MSSSSSMPRSNANPFRYFPDDKDPHNPTPRDSNQHEIIRIVLNSLGNSILTASELNSRENQTTITPPFAHTLSPSSSHSSASGSTETSTRSSASNCFAQTATKPSADSSSPPLSSSNLAPVTHSSSVEIPGDPCYLEKLNIKTNLQKITQLLVEAQTTTPLDKIEILKTLFSRFQVTCSTKEPQKIESIDDLIRLTHPHCKSKPELSTQNLIRKLHEKPLAKSFNQKKQLKKIIESLAKTELKQQRVFELLDLVFNTCLEPKLINEKLQKAIDLLQKSAEISPITITPPSIEANSEEIEQSHKRKRISTKESTPDSSSSKLPSSGTKGKKARKEQKADTDIEITDLDGMLDENGKLKPLIFKALISLLNFQNTSGLLC